MRFLISLFLCGGLLAQATLTTTTTSAAATSITGNIQITSTTGATPGTYLYVVDVDGQPGELMLINSISGNTLSVSRGVGGFQRAHISGAGVTLGPLAAFKTTFPNGACVATEIIYTPWININTGIKYACTGGAWTATNGGGGGGGGTYSAGTGLLLSGGNVFSADTTVLQTVQAAQTGATSYCGSINGTDAYACSMTPALISYAVGMVITLVPDVGNTGASSLNAGPSTISIKRRDGTTDTATGDIIAGRPVQLAYNGTNWALLADAGSASSWPAPPFSTPPTTGWTNFGTPTSFAASGALMVLVTNASATALSGSARVFGTARTFIGTVSMSAVTANQSAWGSCGIGVRRPAGKMFGGHILGIQDFTIVNAKTRTLATLFAAAGTVAAGSNADVGEVSVNNWAGPTPNPLSVRITTGANITIDIWDGLNWAQMFTGSYASNMGGTVADTDEVVVFGYGNGTAGYQCSLASFVAQ